MKTRYLVRTLLSIQYFDEFSQCTKYVCEELKKMSELGYPKTYISVLPYEAVTGDEELIKEKQSES